MAHRGQTTPSSSWRRASAVFSLVALVLAGCGSTALRGTASTAVEGLDVGDGTAAGGNTAPVGGATGDLGVGSSTDASGTTDARGAVAAGTDAAGAGGAAAGSSGSAVGRAAGKKPIRVGVYGFDVTAIFAVFGKADEAPQDFYSSFRAMAKHLNERGGIGGRAIVLVTHTADTAGDASTEGQKACQAFTQDNKVDIVYDAVGAAVLAACLKRAGVASVSGGNYATDDADLGVYPGWLLPSAMRIDRLMRSLLEVSVSRVALKRGDKLGVMVDSCPYGPRVYEEVIVPYARKIGVSVTQSSMTCVDNLVEDLAPLTNDVQRATLAFSSSGVTHVIGLHGAEAFIIANFTTNASQQRYFPKYLVTSNAYAWQNSQSEATIKISPDAVPNVSGVGFLPFLDVGPNARFGAAQKKAQAECTKADPAQFGAAAKDDYGKWFALNGFYSHCSAFFLLKDVVEAGGMRLDAMSVRRGFDVLKQRGAVSAAVNNGRLGGPVSSTDGSGFVQAFAYHPQKTFVYVGSPIAVPS